MRQPRSSCRSAHVGGGSRAAGAAFAMVGEVEAGADEVEEEDRDEPCAFLSSGEAWIARAIDQAPDPKRAQRNGGDACRDDVRDVKRKREQKVERESEHA